jgi:hypothetical protein
MTLVRLLCLGLSLALAACGGAIGTPARDGANDTARPDDGPGPDGGAADVPAAPDGGGDTDGGTDGALPPCEAIPEASYASLTIQGSPTDRPPAQHADLNVKLRGWEPAGGELGLIDLAGATDPNAPRLFSLFADDRVPAFVHNYRVYDWDWGCNCRGALVTDWDATLVGMGVTPGEILQCPRSGYDIGQGNAALVLFVDDDSITLKFTREDNVVSGYTIHLVGVCVEPTLRARYEANRAAGTTELPTLQGDQPLGRARGTQLIVAIRDTGAFMDPRSRKDWW